MTLIKKKKKLNLRTIQRTAADLKFRLGLPLCCKCDILVNLMQTFCLTPLFWLKLILNKWHSLRY